MGWLVDTATILSAGVAALAAVLTFIRTGETRRKVDEVHVLVNDRLDRALERIGQLGGALESAGVDIPPKPSDSPTASPATPGAAGGGAAELPG
jgi:hypothetical protein